MSRFRRAVQVITIIFLLAFAALGQAKWSEQQARDWYAKQPWLLGSNYNPASAINQLEMWQADSFDPKRIDLELGWAEGLGMNTMRVFLHDLLWQQDADGFKRRLDQFLTIAAKHKIRPMFVLFDAVWDPDAKLGKQRAPKPGVHNSGWVQSPNRTTLQDPAQYPKLEAYVKGVVGAFGKDQRVLAWAAGRQTQHKVRISVAAERTVEQEVAGEHDLRNGLRTVPVDAIEHRARRMTGDVVDGERESIDLDLCAVDGIADVGRLRELGNLGEPELRPQHRR